MIIALKNTLSHFRCFTETQVSDMLTFSAVSWLQPSGKSRTSFSLSLYLQITYLPLLSQKQFVLFGCWILCCFPLQVFWGCCRYFSGPSVRGRHRSGWAPSTRRCPLCWERSSAAAAAQTTFLTPSHDATSPAQKLLRNPHLQNRTQEEWGFF